MVRISLNELIEASSGPLGNIAGRESFLLCTDILNLGFGNLLQMPLLRRYKYSVKGTPPSAVVVAIKDAEHERVWHDVYVLGAKIQKEGDQVLTRNECDTWNITHQNDLAREGIKLKLRVAQCVQC